MPNVADLSEQAVALARALGCFESTVEDEESALAEARAEAEPERIAELAAAVTEASLSDLERGGVLLADPAARLALADQIAAEAKRLATIAAKARVLMHERAVEIARLISV